MKRLLSPKAVARLDEIGRARAFLAFDFDGTLAPIVADRAAAAMSPRTASLLSEVASLYPCAVISGRARADVADRLGQAQVKHVLGNHGLEPGPDLAVFRSQIARARESLSRSIGGCPGIDVEDKVYSLSVHFRHAPVEREAHARILDAIAALDGDLRAIPGKSVVNLVPARATNKAGALLQLLRSEAAEQALYVGDDDTDEDVFELEDPGHLVTVRVGRSASSAAKYFLETQVDIDVLLERLAAARRDARARRAR